MVRGRWGRRDTPSGTSPAGPPHLRSAWPILALAHFCLCLSALSNHVQCQYGRSGTAAACPRPCASGPGPSGSIWLSCRQGRSPVGSQIALHRLGPQQSWKPGNPSWASRWGRLQPWREVGGGTICRASPEGATGQEGPALLPTHPWGETLAGLLSQELREAAPGCGGVLEFSPGVLGGVWAVVPENRVHRGLGVGSVWFRPWRISHLPDSEAEREGQAE